MLRVRRGQVFVLRQQELQPFILELMPHLRTHFTSELQALPEWELGETLEECLQRALDYGLTERRDLARFAALGACLGWSFDTELEWPAQLLGDERLAPSDRMSRVYERCLRELDQRAEAAALQRRLGI